MGSCQSDLTAQQDQNLKGSKTDYTGYHSYGALFSIAESPLNARVIWTGADDGPDLCDSRWWRVMDQRHGKLPERRSDLCAWSAK